MQQEGKETYHENIHYPVLLTLRPQGPQPRSYVVAIARFLVWVYEVLQLLFVLVLGHVLDSRKSGL